MDMEMARRFRIIIFIPAMILSTWGGQNWKSHFWLAQGMLLAGWVYLLFINEWILPDAPPSSESTTPDGGKGR